MTCPCSCSRCCWSTTSISISIPPPTPPRTPIVFVMPPPVPPTVSHPAVTAPPPGASRIAVAQAAMAVPPSPAPVARKKPLQARAGWSASQGGREPADASIEKVLRSALQRSVAFGDNANREAIDALTQFHRVGASAPAKGEATAAMERLARAGALPHRPSLRVSSHTPSHFAYQHPRTSHSMMPAAPTTAAAPLGSGGGGSEGGTAIVPYSQPISTQKSENTVSVASLIFTPQHVAGSALPSVVLVAPPSHFSLEEATPPGTIDQAAAAKEGENLRGIEASLARAHWISDPATRRDEAHRDKEAAFAAMFAVKPPSGSGGALANSPAAPAAAAVAVQEVSEDD